MLKVKVVSGASEEKCRCSGWLEHWENFSGQKVILCTEKNCINMDITGAHVYKADSDDSNIYIIPLCHIHADSKDTLEIVDGFKLVSADKSKTCEKIK